MQSAIVTVLVPLLRLTSRTSGIAACKECLDPISCLFFLFSYLIMLHEGVLAVGNGVIRFSKPIKIEFHLDFPVSQIVILPN